MEPNMLIPKYTLRGFNIWGFRNLAQMLDYLFGDNQVKTGILVAMNAEKLLKAEEDASLHTLLDDASYLYADGISMVHAIRRKYPQADVSRVAGADLWEALMQRAGQQNTPVFLVGGKPDVLAQTEAKLRAQWCVNLVGSQDGYFTPEQQEALFIRIAASGAAIITVAMGSPKQEIFMRDCCQYYPDALYMGVGGTYDVFTGRVKRAPKLWQKMGLEWFYRLLSQPSRIRRQLKLFKFIGYYFNGRL